LFGLGFREDSNESWPPRGYMGSPTAAAASAEASTLPCTVFVLSLSVETITLSVGTSVLSHKFVVRWQSYEFTSPLPPTAGIFMVSYL